MTEESGRERERSRQSGTRLSESYEHVLLDTLQPPHLRQAPILLSLSLSLLQDNLFFSSIRDVTEPVFPGPHKAQIWIEWKINR